MREGPDLLQLRLKHLIKENSMEKAALLAKACADFQEFGGTRGHFKQSYLVSVCSCAPQETLMEEVCCTVSCTVHITGHLFTYFSLKNSSGVYFVCVLC